MASKKLYPSGDISALGDASAVDGTFDCSDYILGDSRNVTHGYTESNFTSSAPAPAPPDGGAVTKSATPTGWAGALRMRDNTRAPKVVD